MARGCCTVAQREVVESCWENHTQTEWMPTRQAISSKDLNFQTCLLKWQAFDPVSLNKTEVSKPHHQDFETRNTDSEHFLDSNLNWCYKDAQNFE